MAFLDIDYVLLEAQSLWPDLQALVPSQEFIIYTLCLSICGFLASKAIYNRYLHPLSKFPGPFWGSITDLFLVYVITSVPTYGLELHKRYGPIIRLAPNLLSFSDATLLPHVYHRHADKPDFYGSWMFGRTAAMFQSLAHEKHYAKKKLVAPCCSMYAMKRYHEVKIDQRIDELCAKIEERAAIPRKSIDFSEHLRWFLSDTWGHLVYGKPTGCVARGMDVKGLLAALQGVYSMSASAAVMPWLMPLLRHPTWRNWFWRYTKTFKNMEKLFTHFDSMLQQGEADPEIKQSTPFFEGLYTADGPEKSNFSREDLKAEVITFTAATLDGVAAFVSPFFDNLLQHPDALSRLVDEIRSAERHGQLSSPVVSYDETLKLDYFMACVKETLRCDAPAQTILPRLVSQPGYFFYDGSTFVPGGAEMGASPYIVHRDESIFGPKPSEWVPGRWLEGQMPHEKTGAAFDAYVRRMEKYGMWWGYGDRECAGKFYAQMQTQKLCVELLRRFDIKPTLNRKRFTHKRWAVGMFWDQHLQFSKQA